MRMRLCASVSLIGVIGMATSVDIMCQLGYSIYEGP